MITRQGSGGPIKYLISKSFTKATMGSDINRFIRNCEQIHISK